VSARHGCFTEVRVRRRRPRRRPGGICEPG
jgi:hypothetical protein